MCKCINDSLKTGAFLGPLKLTEITTIHKKEDQFDKDNYRPITILPLISKVFENSQVYSYIQYLNPLLCGFRQGHGYSACTFPITIDMTK